jgi:hypothetical protein
MMYRHFMHEQFYALNALLLNVPHSKLRFSRQIEQQDFAILRSLDV